MRQLRVTRHAPPRPTAAEAFDERPLVRSTHRSADDPVIATLERIDEAVTEA